MGPVLPLPVLSASAHWPVFLPGRRPDWEWSWRGADNTTLMAESEEELKSLLMKVKVEGEKVGLKLNIQMREALSIRI